VKVVVTGASGNVGTGLLRALAGATPAHEVVGVCRRPPPPDPPYDMARWHAVDLSAPGAAAALAEPFAGAAAVVHLAWAIQPARDVATLRRVNVAGTRAVLDAAAAAGVGHVVLASSSAVYESGPGKDPVDEHWPPTGIDGSVYSAHKVAVENLLHEFADDHPDVLVTRVRPVLVGQGVAARELTRYFLGPLPRLLLRSVLRLGMPPLLALPAGLHAQLVHADDLGDAVARILDRRAGGTFNIGAEPLRTRQLAELVGARPVTLPPATMAAAVRLSSAARLLAITPGWFRLLMEQPVVGTDHAAATLGWSPRHTTRQIVRELLDTIAEDRAGTSAVLREH
jgi:nucleoside-diphosphate-sugar epimerase